MLNAYGENGFTFLFFQRLHDAGQLVQPFLMNLKRFDSGRRFGVSNETAFEHVQSGDQPEVWLFPNFGKSNGFGEPDALVLYGGYSFWIEVETKFDLIANKASAKNSMIQLLRFHYFNQALKNGRLMRSLGKPHFTYSGVTVRNNGDARRAVVRVAGHIALDEVGKRLVESAKSERDHYVLLSIQKMKGISKNMGGRGRALRSLFSDCVDAVHPKVQQFAQTNFLNNPPCAPPIERFWYQSATGDLNRFGCVEFDDDTARYVRRKS